jgi:hypothetical protein
VLRFCDGAMLSMQNQCLSAGATARDAMTGAHGRAARASPRDAPMPLCGNDHAIAGVQ